MLPLVPGVLGVPASQALWKNVVPSTAVAQVLMPVSEPVAVIVPASHAVDTYWPAPGAVQVEIAVSVPGAEAEPEAHAEAA
jgi:hypothetical protein